jgi:MraZ protein
MVPPLFYGEYLITLDQRSRILVPSVIRQQLDPDTIGTAFYLLPGPNRQLWLFPDRYYELLNLIGEVQPPSQSATEFDQLNFAMAWRMELDNNGRALLPEEAIREFSILRDATLLGVRDHLELWNRDEWDQYHNATLVRPLR